MIKSLFKQFTILLLTIIQKVAIVLNLIAKIFFLVAIIGFLLGINTKTETLQMLAIGIAFFIIPYIVKRLIAKIASLNHL